MTLFDGRLRVAWRAALIALAVMLVLDVVNVGLYIGYSLATRDQIGTWLRSMFFNMNEEFGLGEWIEYAKSLVAAGALLACGRRSAEPIFYALCGVNVWLAFDNAATLHETAGRLLGQTVLGGNAFGLDHAKHTGEFIYLILFGLAVVATLAIALRSSSAAIRPTGLLLSFFVMAPGITGVFIDALRATTLTQDMSVAMLVILEDGGETAMLSVGCALSLGCLVRLLRGSRAHGAAVGQRA